MSEITFETSQEKLAREEAAAAERRAAEQAAIAAQRAAEENERARAAQAATWAKQNALEEEATLARTAKELQKQIFAAGQHVERLRRENAGEAEFVQLRDEAADLAAAIARRPFAALLADPRDLDRLAQLRLLIELWPARKTHKAVELAAAEQELERMKVELAAKEKLFPKVQAAVAKLLKRDGAA